MDTAKVQNTQRLLKISYFLLPLLVGLDKLVFGIVPWEGYMSQFALDALPIASDVFMMAVGVVELVVAFVLLKWTRVGAYIVFVWLLLISLNLLLLQSYDIAARDVVLAVGAFALAKLTEARTA